MTWTILSAYFHASSFMTYFPLIYDVMFFQGKTKWTEASYSVTHWNTQIHYEWCECFCYLECNNHNQKPPSAVAVKHKD